MPDPIIDLDAVSIPSPCPASWAAMAGDERRRFCEECSLHVHDLSAGTSAEARRLLDGAEAGGPCVRYLRDGEGRMITREEPERRASRFGRRTRGFAAALLAAWSIFGFGCGATRETELVSGDGGDPPPCGTEVMGEAVMPASSQQELVGRIALPMSTALPEPSVDRPR